MIPRQTSSPGLGAHVSHHAFRVTTREAGTAPLVLAAANVTGDADQTKGLAETWLRGSERSRYLRYKVQHARDDFVAGRIAAKTAIAALANMPSPPPVEIMRGVWHQPSVRGAGDGVGVTLAHAGGQAVAIAFDDRIPCGIDIEASTRDAADVVATQVTSEEADWARADTSDANPRWMLLWTAKEALGKCFRTGILFPGNLPPTAAWTDEGNGGWRATLAQNELLEVRAFAGERFVTSVVLPTELLDQPPVIDALAWLGKAIR